MKDMIPTPEGGGPFKQVFNWLSGFLKGLGNWMWRLVPEGIKSKFDVSKAGLWGMITPVFSLFKNIYFLMTIPAIIVVYKLYEALKDAGIIAKFQIIVDGVLNTVMYIANECFPLITNIKALGACVADAPLHFSDKAAPDILLPHASLILNLVT